MYYFQKLVYFSITFPLPILHLFSRVDAVERVLILFKLLFLKQLYFLVVSWYINDGARVVENSLYGCE